MISSSHGINFRLYKIKIHPYFQIIYLQISFILWKIGLYFYWLLYHKILSVSLHTAEKFVIIFYGMLCFAICLYICVFNCNRCLVKWPSVSQFSCSAVSDSATPWTAARQVSLCITNSWSLYKLMSIELVMPSNHLILCCPLLLLPSVFPSISVFSQWVSSSQQVAKVLEFQLHHLSFQWLFRVDFLYDCLVLPPWSPRDFQESSPTPQFKSINSSSFSYLYNPTLTSIHDYWKNHSFD